MNQAIQAQPGGAFNSASLPAHLKQCTIAANPRAECRHEPRTGFDVPLQRPLQSKNYAWAAHIAKFAQHPCTPPQLLLAKLQRGLQGRQNVASSRMQNPLRNLVLSLSGFPKHFLENHANMIDHKDRNAFIQHVAQHPVARLESKQLAVACVQNGRIFLPLNPRKRSSWFLADNHRTRRVSEKTRAD